MASSTNIPISVQRRDQRNAVLAGFLGWRKALLRGRRRKSDTQDDFR